MDELNLDALLAGKEKSARAQRARSYVLLVLLALLLVAGAVCAALWLKGRGDGEEGKPPVAQVPTEMSADAPDTDQPSEPDTEEAATGEDTPTEETTDESPTGDENAVEGTTDTAAEPVEATSEDQPTGEDTTAEDATPEDATAENEDGDRPTGEDATAEAGVGGQPTGEDATGEPPTDEDATGENASGEQTTGEDATGEPPTEAQPTEDSQPTEEGTQAPADEPDEDETSETLIAHRITIVWPEEPLENAPANIYIKVYHKGTEVAFLELNEKKNWTVSWQDRYRVSQLDLKSNLPKSLQGSVHVKGNDFTVTLSPATEASTAGLLFPAQPEDGPLPQTGPEWCLAAGELALSVGFLCTGCLLRRRA